MRFRGLLSSTTNCRDMDADLVDPSCRVQLRDVGETAKVPHISISVHDDPRDLKQMEEDEEEMERANQEVLQMQQRMLEGACIGSYSAHLFTVHGD